MKGRAANKTERERFDKLSELGCIVCLNDLQVFTPPAIHHMDGKTKPNSHTLTIPLCGNHHQIKGKGWISRHGDGKKAFEREYGTEAFLLDLTNTLIGA